MELSDSERSQQDSDSDSDPISDRSSDSNLSESCMDRDIQDSDYEFDASFKKDRTDDEYDTEEEKRKQIKSANSKKRPASCISSPETKTINKKLKRKRTEFVHKFRNEWTSTYPWLSQSDKGNEFFRCNLCTKDLKAGKSAVKKHANSKLHTDNEKRPEKQSTIEHSFNNTTKSVSTVKQVKQAEIRLGMFIAEHNISISASDHLVELLKTIDPNSKVLQKIQCDRTKTTAIIQNVIGRYSREEIIRIAQTTPFSLIIDGSTDRTKKKHLAVIMRFEKNFEPMDAFLGLLPIKDATANGIFSALTNFMTEHGIPYHENMVGFASDGENTMFGCNNSVATKLREEISNLFTMKCICHSLSLAVSAASKQLPESVESLISNIYNYMKGVVPKDNSIMNFNKKFSK